MNFLSIDCSTNIGTLFVKYKSKTFNKILQSDKSNADLLMKQILDFFEENSLKFDDVSAIFVNQGPGNFSGLRGSLAIAKGISISKNIDLFGYNTFIWSCAKFFNKHESIFCLIEFRGKYFIQKISKNFKKNSQIKEIKKDEIIEKYHSEFVVVPKIMTEYLDKEILKLNNVNIANLDHNELEFLQLKGLLDKYLIKPIYLS